MDLSLYALLATRLKAAPAFDKLDSSAPENDEFGASDGTPRHFTRFPWTIARTFAPWYQIRKHA